MLRQRPYKVIHIIHRLYYYINTKSPFLRNAATNAKQPTMRVPEQRFVASLNEQPITSRRRTGIILMPINSANWWCFLKNHQSEWLIGDLSPVLILKIAQPYRSYSQAIYRYILVIPAKRVIIRLDVNFRSLEHGRYFWIMVWKRIKKGYLHEKAFN